MRLKNLMVSLALVIPMIMGSGLVVAEERLWKSVYQCGKYNDSPAMQLLALDKLDLRVHKQRHWRHFHFMNDGEIVIESGTMSYDGRWETYGPIEYPHTFSSSARIQSLVYNDLDEFHEFILTRAAPVPDGYDSRERILLDKDLMEGTRTFTGRLGTEEESVYKMRFICEHVYPRG